MSAELESSMRRAGRMLGRKFFEALKGNPKDQSAIGIVPQIDELFAIDGQAQEQGLRAHNERT